MSDKNELDWYKNRVLELEGQAIVKTNELDDTIKFHLKRIHELQDTVGLWIKREEITTDKLLTMTEKCIQAESEVIDLNKQLRSMIEDEEGRKCND